MSADANLVEAVTLMTSLTSEQRGRLIAITLRHAIECGEIEASTIRGMLSRIENGQG